MIKALLACLLALPLVACTVGGGGTGGDDGDDDGSGSNPGGGIAGSVTSSAEWTGTVKVIGPTVIEPGVTITVGPGTTIDFTPNAGIDVKGTLDVNGTQADRVTLGIAPGSQGIYWGGLDVHGTLTMDYAIQTGGNILTYAGSTVTITDTEMSKAAGDFLVTNGGNVTVTYSNLGSGSGDTTHCQIHTGGSGNTLTITHSNIKTAPYGIMFYAGTGANFTFNNWTSGAIDVDTQPGVQGDFSNGYFAGGAPTAGSGATITADNLSATPLTDAGPRNATN